MIMEIYLSLVVGLTIFLPCLTVYSVKKLAREGKPGGPFITHVVVDCMWLIAGMVTTFMTDSSVGVVLSAIAVVDLVWGIVLMNDKSWVPVWVQDGRASMKKGASR